MTNKELQEILSKYPSGIDQCIDMDTNKPSLVVYGKDRDYFKKRVGDVISKKFCGYE